MIASVCLQRQKGLCHDLGRLCHLCKSPAVAVQSNVRVADSQAPALNEIVISVWSVVG